MSPRYHRMRAGSRGIGERTCSCGAVWRAARFCGHCGALLRDADRPRTSPARRTRLLAAVATVLLIAALVAATPDIAGLWPAGRMAGGDLGVDLPPVPPTRRVAPPPSPRADTPPVPVRCRDADRCNRWRLPQRPLGAGAPVMTSDGHLVVVTVDGLAGFAAGTGERVWDLPVDHGGAATLTAIENTDGTVLAVGPAERVWSLDAATGAVVWTREVAGAYAVRAARADPQGWTVAVRVRAEDGLASAVAVLGVDPATGEPRWRRDAADAALTDAGAVLQDTQGQLSGLVPQDGAIRWRLETSRPAAGLFPLGDVVVAVARADALVIDPASGEVREELAQPSGALLIRDGTMLWSADERIDYLDGDGGRWDASVPALGGCCSGFALDTATLTVLSGRGELVSLDRRTGEVVARETPRGVLAESAGRAWLQGPLLVVTVLGAPGGLGQIHEAASGAHLADVTEEAEALTAGAGGDWVVLAAELAMTLSPGDRSDRAASLATSRPRIR